MSQFRRGNSETRPSEHEEDFESEPVSAQPCPEPVPQFVDTPSKNVTQKLRANLLENLMLVKAVHSKIAESSLLEKEISALLAYIVEREREGAILDAELCFLRSSVATQKAHNSAEIQALRLELARAREEAQHWKRASQ